jgi:hypothetical protein
VTKKVVGVFVRFVRRFKGTTEVKGKGNGQFVTLQKGTNDINITTGVHLLVVLLLLEIPMFAITS